MTLKPENVDAEDVRSGMAVWLYIRDVDREDGSTHLTIRGLDHRITMHAGGCMILGVPDEMQNDANACMGCVPSRGKPMDKEPLGDTCKRCSDCARPIHPEIGRCLDCPALKPFRDVELASVKRALNNNCLGELNLIDQKRLLVTITSLEYAKDSAEYRLSKQLLRDDDAAKVAIAKKLLESLSGHEYGRYGCEHDHDDD